MFRISSWRPLALCLLACGCGGHNSRPEAGEDLPPAAEVAVEGTVRVAGSTPFERVMLTRSEGPELELRGDLRTELLRLQGAVVRVEGRPSRRNLFRISGYEILEIGGERPLVGVLERVEGGALGLRTPTGDWRELDSPPASLAARAGAKVWIVLGPDGTVRSYGVLREGAGEENG